MEENNDIENIDELSRSVIEPFELNPPEGAWDSLDAALTKKQAAVYRKRANRFKMLSITLALLLFSFIIFYYFSLTQNTNRTGEVIDKTLPGNYENANSNNNSENNQLKSGASQNSLGEASSGSQYSESKNTNENSATAERKNESPLIHYNNNGAIEKMEIEIAANEVEQGREKKNNKLTSEASINAGVDISGNVKTESEPSIENATQNESRVISDDSQKKNLSVGTPLENETESTGTPSNISGDSSTIKGNESKPAEPVLKELSFTATSSANDSLLNKTNRIASRLSIALFYAPCFVGYHLKDNNPNDDENVLDYQNREQPEYSFATGLLLGYDVNNRWSLYTGCTFSTAAYSMTYSTLYVKYGWDNQLHIQYPTSSGIIEVPNSGNNSWNEGDSLNVEVFCDQLVKFVNVPLTARYQVKKNRFTWYAEAGLSANFIVQELVKVSFGTFNKTIFDNVDGLKKVNLGYVAGVGSQYNFNNGFGFFIEPVFKGSITSITYNTPLDCYPFSIGLNTGVSFHF